MCIQQNKMAEVVLNMKSIVKHFCKYLPHQSIFRVDMHCVHFHHAQLVDDIIMKI